MTKNLRACLLVLLCFLCINQLHAANETEPNNTLATANPLQQGSIMIGAISPSSDIDYFKSLLQNEGTLKIYFNYSGGNSTTDFYLNVYNKAHSQIGSTSKINTASGTDSLIIYCRQADSITILISGSTSLNYEISYSVLESGTRDPEPNNTFAQATYFAQPEIVDGHVGYYANIPDGYDYFKTKLPDDGTLKVYVDKINTSNSTGADFYLSVYNKAGSQIGARSFINQPLGANTTDTLTIYCRQADSVTFLINAGDCFSYKLRYEVIPSGLTDAEPNNTPAQALYFAQPDTVDGHVGYYANIPDGYDYFKTKLPDAGTMKVYVDKINTSNSTDADFYLYAYNKAGSQIGAQSFANQPLGVNNTDTLIIYCRQADSVTFLIYASDCFSYKLRYEVIPSGIADAEPNNSFAEAISFAQPDTVKGRVGYNANSTDGYDYFKTTLPNNGTLRIFVDKINTSNSTGADFYIYAYNSIGSLIGSLAVANQPLGANNTDTLTITGVQAGVAYVVIYASDCFSYKIRYENGYYVSGNVFDDGDGNVNNKVDGNLYNPASAGAGPVYAIAYNNTTTVIENYVPINSAGKYAFANIKENSYSIYLSSTIPTIGQSSTPTITLPAKWVNTGEINCINTPNCLGNDGNVNGSLPLGAVNGNITQANFGIEQEPTATQKTFVVANTSFGNIPPAGYPAIFGYVTISSNSNSLTGYNGTGGKLSGTDGEDCAMADACNTNSKFKIGAINGNTKLYYDFGAGAVAVNDSTEIAAYNPAMLVIYGQKGSGTGTNPIGFTFSLVDDAGMLSPFETYAIQSTTPLPVILISFGVTPKGDYALVNWETGVEATVNNFEVLSSNDGKIFTSIDSKPAKGNNSQYSSIIKHPAPGFYKLKINEHDGSHLYSNTVKLSIKAGATPISLFPNPAQNEVTIKGIPDGIKVSVMDINGHIVMPLLYLQDNKLRIADLPAGFYFVHIVTDEITTFLKLVKKQ